MPDRTFDLFPVGSYLTDGNTLLGVVGTLPQEPSLRLVENCRTLEIMVVSVQDLRAQGVQPVVAPQNRRRETASASRPSA